MKKILIVGGVAGGASTAARLRRNDESVEIILFEKGEYISYANCGLPYYIGDVITDREQLFVQTVAEFSNRFNLDIRPSNEISSVDTEKKMVTVINKKTGKQYEESYDKLVLSPGAKPFKPPIKGIDSDRVFYLRNVDDTDKIKAFAEKYKPSKAVIVGAGYIGIEMADNLQHICDSVTVIEMANRVLPFFDYEMSAMIEQHLTSHGIDVLLSKKVIAVEPLKANKEHFAGKEVILQSGERIQADIIIVAAGVRPDTGFLQSSGIKLTPNGSIIVNKSLQTNKPDVYALGDAISAKHKILDDNLNIYLAGPASKQGRIVADNILSETQSEYEGTIGTAIIKVIDITAGYTGVSEDSLKKQKRSFIASYTHGLSHAGYYPNALPLTIKLLFTPDTGEILGSQMIGLDGIDKRLDVIAALIHKKGTIYDLTQFDHSYAPPFSSSKDPVTIAGFVAENIINGKVKVVHWDEVSEEFINNTTILDVRTKEENEIGALPNSLLIPIDELRGRLDEIPQGKNILVYCRAGHRGYLACRILEQKGFANVYNLSGGYKIYETAHRLSSSKDVFADEMDALEDTDVDQPNDQQNNCFKAVLSINACGLQCPGPILKLKEGIDKINSGESLQIDATDPGFLNDLKSWCRVTGNELISLNKTDNTYSAFVKKATANYTLKQQSNQTPILNDNKTLIVFSDDMDRALASFVIANGAASLGKQVTMFFTFWGLNVIKKENKAQNKRDFIGTMFGKMMPSNSKKLNLSKMNMMGIGSKLMRFRMKSKQVDSLEQMILTAISNGVRLIACQMSMDVMGVVKDDLINGVEIGGVATYLEEAEKSNINLFI